MVILICCVNLLFLGRGRIEKNNATTLRSKWGQDPRECVLRRKWSPIKSNQTLSHQLTSYCSVHRNHSLRLHCLRFHFIFVSQGKCDSFLTFELPFSLALITLRSMMLLKGILTPECLPYVQTLPALKSSMFKTTEIDQQGFLKCTHIEFHVT